MSGGRALQLSMEKGDPSSNQHSEQIAQSCGWRKLWFLEKQVVCKFSNTHIQFFNANEDIIKIFVSRNILSCTLMSETIFGN